MWNLEKWHRWTCLQGRNREADPRTDMWTQEGGARWDELGDWDWLMSIVTWKTELVGTCCAVQGVQLYPCIQYFFMCYVSHVSGENTIQISKMYKPDTPRSPAHMAGGFFTAWATREAHRPDTNQHTKWSWPNVGISFSVKSWKLTLVAFFSNIFYMLNLKTTFDVGTFK